MKGGTHIFNLFKEEIIRHRPLLNKIKLSRTSNLKLNIRIENKV